MTIWRDVEHCRSAMVRQLHEVWSAKRGDAGVPLRAEFDPAEIKPLLANMLIVDLEPDPFRVRYRLVGTKVVAASGYDFTGRYLDEMNLASGVKLWLSYYRTVSESGRPLFGTVSVPAADGSTFAYEFGIFPVTTDGSAVTQCLDIEDYGDFNPRLSELQDKIAHWRPTPITAKEDGEAV